MYRRRVSGCPMHAVCLLPLCRFAFGTGRSVTRGLIADSGCCSIIGLDYGGLFEYL